MSTKKLAVITSILVLSGFIWRISERMSTDAITLAVGVLLGAMAAIPLCLVVMMGKQSRQEPPPQPAAPPAVVPQLVIVSQRIERQIVVNQSEAWKISHEATGKPLEIEQDTAYPIEYK